MFASLSYSLNIFGGGAIGLGIGTLAGFIHQFIAYQKKEKIKPDAMVCAIIGSNIAVLFFPLFPFMHGSHLEWLIRECLNSVAVHPQAISRVLRYFPLSGLLIGFWPLLMVCLGMGVFFRKNAARIALIIYCLIHVLGFLFSWFLSGCHIKQYTLSCAPAIDALTLADHSFLVVLLPVLYVFYFTRPVIKSQFK